MIHDFKAIKRLAKIINILYLPTALPCKIAEKRERQNRNTAGTENFCINFVARNVFEKVCKVYKGRESFGSGLTTDWGTVDKIPPEIIIWGIL